MSRYGAPIPFRNNTGACSLTNLRLLVLHPGVEPSGGARRIWQLCTREWQYLCVQSLIHQSINESALADPSQPASKTGQEEVSYILRLNRGVRSIQARQG
eukprot:GHVU01158666.1.p2 GENE.GHVU01158666.1~~GHVU01158666.1.p2  ORF type:complete len:100 (-),score=2.00 GHVU01158666.1:1098-1397(-)